jgi:hypothetical protein
MAVEGILGTFCGLMNRDIHGWLECAVWGILSGADHRILAHTFHALNMFCSQIVQCINVIRGGCMLWASQKTQIVDEVNHVGLVIEWGMAMMEDVGHLYAEGSLGHRWFHGDLMYQQG